MADKGLQGVTGLAAFAGEEFCYLTTIGRVSGLPREIEIWFAVNGQSVLMLSGGREKSNWVRNLLRSPEVTVRIAGQTFNGTARILEEKSEDDAIARRLLVSKYQPLHDGDLSDWGRTALPVKIDIYDSSNPPNLPPVHPA